MSANERTGVALLRASQEAPTARERREAALDYAAHIAREVGAMKSRGDAPAAWTRERPTAPGWYWHRLTGCAPEVVRITGTIHSPLLCWVRNSQAVLVSDMDGEWSGPIPAPAEVTP